MKNVLLYAFVILALSWQISAFKVEQIHTAWTGNGFSELGVSFVTPASPSSQTTTVYYGTEKTSLTESQTGYNYEFGTDGHNFRINNVVLKNLKPNTHYYYKVGDSKSASWSDVLSFYTKTSDLTFATYGDFGYANDRSLPDLISEAGSVFDAVLHIGDFAYNLDSNKGIVGDDFMNSIQPIASKVPYMTCPGNHEQQGNFTHYKNRFSLIKDGVGTNSKSDTPLWYSFDIDNIHFVAIDTEVYAYFRDQAQIDRQLAWLDADLTAANKNRQNVPWIIMYGHKGWFMDSTNYTGFEILAHKHGVDLYFCGHIHNYERFYPQHDGEVDKQDKSVYTNPKYMVTLVVGSAGCHEDISSNTGPSHALVVSEKSYGFGHFKAYNETHLYFEWNRTSKADGTPQAKVDDFWIVQKHHGPRA